MYKVREQMLIMEEAAYILNYQILSKQNQIEFIMPGITNVLIPWQVYYHIAILFDKTNNTVKTYLNGISVQILVDRIQ